MPLKELGKEVERRVRRVVRGLPGRRWQEAPHVSDASPIIVGGCGRSGTTLLSAILNAHPNLYCGPESRLLTTPDVNPKRLGPTFGMEPAEIRAWMRACPGKGAFVERFFAEAAARAGKTRWCDKTPGNVVVLDRIFEQFPTAVFVHVIRDGRDVSCSYRTWPKYRLVHGQRIETGIRRPIAECAERWVTYVSAGLGHRGDDRYTEVRYEDLVRDPEREVRRLLDFAGEPWSDDVLRLEDDADAASRLDRRRIDTTALGRWRRDLTGDDLETVLAIAGDLLRDLGYRDDENVTYQAAPV